jgi:ATP/maltotriose-dependent transcriptional regulator MalT
MHAIAEPGRPRFSGIRGLIAAAHERVYARLARAVSFPITVVSARPGFDRATVVRDFLRTSAVPYRLVAFDLGDAGMLGVVRALADALQDAAPALRSTFVTVYDRLRGSSDGPEQLGNWVADQLEATASTIVLDCQGSLNDPRVALLLSTLIDRTQRNVRWIVSLESCERLPVARWLAEGLLDLPIDEADLELSEDALLSSEATATLGLSREGVVKISRVTGGWPAAFALGIAAGSQLDLGAAPTDARALYAYLVDAVLSTLSGQERAFLDSTCLMTTFDAALLECAGFDDVGEIVALLADGIGVLHQVREGSYQFERLFAEALRTRIRARGEATFRRIATAVAQACLRDGRFAQAISIYAELADFNAIGALVSAHGFALMERGDSDMIQRTLALMPDEIVFEFPGALAVKASLESLYGKFDVAEAWFRLALDRISDESQRAEIVYRFAIDLVRRERDDAIELLRPVVSKMSHETPLAAPLLALLGTAYALNGQTAEAALAIDRALVLLPGVSDRGARAKILHQAAFVALRLCNTATAKALSLQAHHEAFACYNFDLAARALSIQYNIALDVEDDVLTSIACLEQLASLSVRAGSRHLLLYATLCRYELEVLRGNTTVIEQLDGQLQSLEVFFSVLTTETLLPAQALQAAWSGEFYRAFRLLRWSGEHQINADRQAYRFAEIAMYAAAAGLRVEASSAAERALTIVRHLRSADKTMLQTLSFVALTFVLLRRPARAAKLLAELNARSGNYERVDAFVRVVASLAARWTEGVPPSGLGSGLEALRARDLGGLARMIEALPLPETVRSRSAQLTASEREILKQLCVGSNPRNVALHTGRSAQRLDAVIRSLCRKLGCKDWHDAVTVARSEGLLYDETELAADLVASC